MSGRQVSNLIACRLIEDIQIITRFNEKIYLKVMLLRKIDTYHANIIIKNCPLR